MPLRHRRVTEAEPIEQQRRVVQPEPANEDDDIGTRSHLGQGGREAAAILQRTQALCERPALRGIADRAGHTGQAVKRARSRHIGAEAAEQWLAAGTQQAGRGGRGFTRCDGAAIDERRGDGRHGAECRQPGTGTRAVTAFELERAAVGGAANAEPVAHQRAERTGPGQHGGRHWP